MDPVTQGALGAVVAQSWSRKGWGNNFVSAGVAVFAGWLGGMAADLDVLIQSSRDPFLFLEYHRHFTHSLIFIPFGGLIVAAFIYALFGRSRQWPFRQLVWLCTLGYASHGLLDSCTSYGTLLWWPFSNARVAFDTISIIDPLFTVPLIIALIVSVKRDSVKPARWALLWALIYIALGFVQHDRAVNAGFELAASRGHTPAAMEAKPGFANLLLFKTIYQYQDRYYVDAVRVGLETKSLTGESIAVLNKRRDLPWLKPNSQQAKDLDRFEWFSSGYVAMHPTTENEVVDIRYSMLPNEVDALWGTQLYPERATDQHGEYVTHRNMGEDTLSRYWDMLITP